MREEEGRRKLSALGRAALAYGRRGLYVFPMHSVDAMGACSCNRDCGRDAGKHPRISDWERQATTQGERIRRWWTCWPRANVGLALGPSRLVVIDVDPRNGGEESHRALCSRLGAYETVRSLTGGGGVHDYFRKPERPIRSGSDAFGAAFGGVDVKGAGGCVVLPPSLHQSLRRYAWEAQQDAGLAEMPAAWVAALAQPVHRLVAGESDEVIPEGKRRQALLRLAGRLRRLGLNAQTIGDVLQAANVRQCSPPLEACKIERMVADIAARYSPCVSLLPRSRSRPAS
jgi:hypothetical protein